MSDNHDMAAALTDKGVHTFRHGQVVVTLRETAADDDKFTVIDMDAEYFGQPVILDLPLHWCGFPHDGDPLQTAYGLIANLVRHNAIAGSQ
jgi:hypothetical protein